MLDSPPRAKRQRILICGPWNVAGGIASWVHQVFSSDLAHVFDLALFNIDKDWAPIGPPGEMPRSAETWIQGLLRVARFEARLRSYRPRSVFIPSVLGLGLLRDLIMCQIALARGVKPHVHLRSTNWQWLTSRSPVSRRVLKTLTRGVGLVTLMEEIPREARWFFADSGYCVLPNFIADDRLEAARQAVLHRGSVLDNQPRILYAGLVSAKKGVFDLLDTASAVPRASFDIVGPCTAEVRQQVLRRIQKEGLSGRVRLWKPVPYKELSGFYARASLFVLLSHTEAFPNVFLEAMAHGIPIVATDVGAARSVVTGGPEPAGVVIAPRDPSLASRVINELISSSQQSVQMGRAGIRRVRQEYSEGVFVRRFAKLIADSDISCPMQVGRSRKVIPLRQLRRG